MTRDLSAFPALALLESRLGSALVAAIVEAFLEDTPATLGKLQAAGAAGRASDVAMYAHAIAGSAAEMGLEALNAAGRQLERIARSDPAQIAAHLPGVLALGASGLDSLGRTFADS